MKGNICRFRTTSVSRRLLTRIHSWGQVLRSKRPRDSSGMVATFTESAHDTSLPFQVPDSPRLQGALVRPNHRRHLLWGTRWGSEHPSVSTGLPPANPSLQLCSASSSPPSDPRSTAFESTSSLLTLCPLPKQSE